MRLNCEKYIDNVSKSVLYEIDGDKEISTFESHKDDKCKDEVLVVFHLQEDEKGIFAQEYVSPLENKEGAKRADILCGVLNEKDSYILLCAIEMKRNMVFTPCNGRNVTTMVNRIGGFVGQLIASLREMQLLSIASQCNKSEYHFALATRSWDMNCILELSDSMKPLKSADLTIDRKKTQLRNLELVGKKAMLQNFAKKKFAVQNKEYDFDVYLLEKGETTYQYKFQLCDFITSKNEREKVMAV